MMAVVNSCCGKASLKTGSIIIGILLFIFTVIFLFTTVGLVSGWRDFDTQFLDDRLARLPFLSFDSKNDNQDLSFSRLNSTTANRVRQKVQELVEVFQTEIRPVWKNEFISLYCFLPW